MTLDTSEKDEAVAKLRKEQEARIRSETDLANSRMAYEMLKIQMTNLQKKHDRQRSLKLKYGKSPSSIYHFWVNHTFQGVNFPRCTLSK